MVDGLLAKISIGIVLPVCSPPFASGLPALGFHLKRFDSQSEESLDKVSVMNRSLLVDCPERFPVSQTNSMYQIAVFGRGSTYIEDLERLPADWEREIIFHCKSIPHLEILSNQSYNSPFLAIPVSVK